MEILTTTSDSFDSDRFIEPANDLQENIKQNTTWSMEILPHNIADVSLIPEFINEIYITMIPGANLGKTHKCF